MKHIFINIRKIVFLAYLILGGYFYSQVRISNSNANPVAANSSAFIDASSNTTFNDPTKPNLGKGLLFPRTDLVAFTAFSQAPFGIDDNYPTFYDGFLVFNTVNTGVAGVGATEGTLCRGFWYYDNPTTNITGGTWRAVRPDLCSIPIIVTLNCAGAIHTGTLTQGSSASGVSTEIPYTGGNGISYPPGSGILSTGVTGLTATLQGGTLANGNGTLTYIITGTPSSAGTATFTISFGGKSCSFTRTVNPLVPIANLNCSNAVFSPSSITQMTSYNGTLTVPYTGGNGGAYPVHNFTNNGLNFSRSAGTLATGNGNIIYNVTGTPINSGTMTFSVNLGGSSCNINKQVLVANEVVMCGSSKRWKTHNLGANESLNPNIPVQGIHGNYYQWGRRNPVANASTPPGPISGYNQQMAQNGSWTGNSGGGPQNPCPSGFRVPTSAEWRTLINASTYSNVGSFVAGPNNFGSAGVLTCSDGRKLTFPAAGMRRGFFAPSPNPNDGTLLLRGSAGFYWSSTQIAAPIPVFTFPSPKAEDPGTANRLQGLPVRCISQ